MFFTPRYRREEEDADGLLLVPGQDQGQGSPLMSVLKASARARAMRTAE
jgi:hypothetical protein